jgi:hypothetical protein
MLKGTMLVCAVMIVGAAEVQDPVYAYLDPGTGSIVIQAVVAGVVGALAVCRFYWSRLKGLFRRTSPKDNDVRQR